MRESDFRIVYNSLTRCTLKYIVVFCVHLVMISLFKHKVIIIDKELGQFIKKSKT